MVIEEHQMLLTVHPKCTMLPAANAAMPGARAVSSPPPQDSVTNVAGPTGWTNRADGANAGRPSRTCSGRTPSA